MSKQKPPDELEKNEGPRSFARVLEQLGDGFAHAELSRELNSLCSKMRDEGLAQKKDVRGELTLKIALVTNDSGVFSIGYDVKTKEPAPKRPGSIFWLTKGGNLTIENPRQQKLPLREVNNNNDSARDVGDDRGAREV